MDLVEPHIEDEEVKIEEITLKEPQILPNDDLNGSEPQFDSEYSAKTPQNMSLANAKENLKSLHMKGKKSREEPTRDEDELSLSTDSDDGEDGDLDLSIYIIAGLSWAYRFAYNHRYRAFCFIMGLFVYLYLAQVISNSQFIFFGALMSSLLAILTCFPSPKASFSKCLSMIQRVKKPRNWRLAPTNEIEESIGKNECIEFIEDKPTKESTKPQANKGKVFTHQKNTSPQRRPSDQASFNETIQEPTFGATEEETGGPTNRDLVEEERKNFELVLAMERQRKWEMVREMRHAQRRVVDTLRRINQGSWRGRIRDTITHTGSDGDSSLPYILQMIQMQENEETANELQHWIEMNSDNRQGESMRNPGMSEAEIRMIPSFEFGATEGNFDEETCSICLASFEERSVCKRLACQHFFHDDCVSEWLKLSRACPFCKSAHH